MKQHFLRYSFFILGVFINSFGISFITKATLGTSPISSVPYVLSLKFAPSFGTISFFINVLFIIGQIVLLKKEFQPIQLLQILVNVIFSIFIDFSMMLLDSFHPDTILLKLCALVLGCAILGFGISIEVAANVVFVPGEGIVNVIASKLPYKFGNVKICFDATLVSVALILSLIFFHGINGLGIGTIISAFLVGKFVNIWDLHLPCVSYIKELKEIS